MNTLIMVAQLLLGISILAGVHELGHLLMAKLFGMRVEKFSIGFPPTVFSVKFGETEYCFGATPLGGFVKISGMVDESFDTKGLSSTPQSWEFRAKPTWQRLIVMLGGVLVNILTGIMIFVGTTYFLGQTYYDIKEVNRHGIYATDIAREIGLRTGDKIVAINNYPIEIFSDIQDPNYFLEDNAYYTVIRNDSTLVIPIPSSLTDRLSEEENPYFVQPLFPFAVDSISPGTNAEKAGLKKNDKILAVNNKKTIYYQEFKAALYEKKGQKINLIVQRNSDTILLPVQVTQKGTLGFYTLPLLKESHRSYTFSESVPTGISQAFKVAAVQAKALRKILLGEVSAQKSLGGPIAIAKTFGTSWDWIRFWTLCGLLSIVLAFMNLLPIPALDGGHVVFLLYEMVSGRVPSVRFLETMQKIGVVTLLTIMAFVFGNDIYNLFN